MTYTMYVSGAHISGAGGAAALPAARAVTDTNTSVLGTHTSV